MPTTTTQQTYIRANHRRQSIAEMGRNLKITADDVLEFMTSANLATTRPHVVAITKSVNPYKTTGRKYFTHDDKMF